MRINYICKKIFNEDGDIIDYRIEGNTENRQLPSNQYRILEGPKTKHPMASFDGDKWVVIEDPSARTFVDAKESLTSGIQSDVGALVKSNSDTGILSDVIEIHYSITDAAFISTQGHLAEKDTTSFNTGDTLDTEQKVKDYYTEVLREIYLLRKTRWSTFRNAIGI